MRNLKRVLSLTLASVMLLGMMVIGSSAAAQGYSDVDESHNIEAIEVLQAVGVMVGDGDGTLRPNAQVSRGEMAVIMAKLMDLDYEYYAGAGIHPFNDMVGHYAEAYVAACKANGIIAGRTETTFDPSAGVTAIEAASMMMRALGYFKFASDYAAGFEVATVTQGTKISLFDGVGSNATAAMTRNQVAQLALNTLESGMVEPSTTLSVTTSDGTTVTAGGVSYHYVTSNATYEGSIWVPNNSASDFGQASDLGGILQLGEQLFKGDLVLRNEKDTLGRHINHWTYKNNEIGEYEKDVVASYTKTVKNGTIYTLLASKVYDDYNLNVYVNGRDVGVRGKVGAKANADLYTGSRSTSNVDVPGTGTGVLTTVYQNDDLKELSIVEIYTYVAKVVSDYDESRKAINVEILSNTDEEDKAYEKNGLGPVKVSEITTNVSSTLYAEDHPEIAGLKEGDYIIFTYSEKDKAIANIAKANVVSGTVSSVTDADSDRTDGSVNKSLLKQAVIGGVTYGYNDNYMSRGDALTTYELGTEAIVVLDDFGNIIWDDEAIAAGNNFLYVDGLVRDSGFSNRASAQVYFADGTSGIITVSDITVKYAPYAGNGMGPGTDKAKGDSNGSNTTRVDLDDDVLDVNSIDEERGTAKIDMKKLATAGVVPSPDDDDGTEELYFRPNATYGEKYEDVQFNGWYSYTQNNNGTYKLTQLWREDTDFDGDGKDDAYNQVAYVRIDGQNDEDDDHNNVKINGDSTRYFIGNDTFDGGFGLGGGFTANSETTFILVKGSKTYVYEGVRNIPEVIVKPTKDGVAQKFSTDAIITAAKRETDGAANVVLIIDDDMRISGKRSDDLVYVIKLNSTYKENGKENGDTIYVYDVLLNGAKTTLESKDYLAASDSKDILKAYVGCSVIDGYYDFDSADELREGNVNNQDGYVAGKTKNGGANGDANIHYKGDAVMIGNGDGTYQDTYQITKDTKVRVLLLGKTSTNLLLGDDSAPALRSFYSASALAGLDGSPTAPAYDDFVYDYFGILEDDWYHSDVFKVLYVIVHRAK